MIYDADMHQIFITVPLLRRCINNKITRESIQTGYTAPSAIKITVESSTRHEEQ